MSWPTQGDRTTFRRRALTVAAGGAASIAAILATAVLTAPALLQPLLPLCASAALLLALYTHTAARSAARRAEVTNSFAGMRVLHQGSAYHVSSATVLGEYTSRRHAASAAMDRGGWALVVRAWDRYYLLACEPPSAPRDAASVPVSFRSRAVADVVPSLRDDIAVGA